MITPSGEIVALLTTFAVATTAPTFRKMTQLLYGAILAPGRRTVSAALQVLGLGGLATFGKYHRVLNRDRWSPWVLSELLLAVLGRPFLTAGAPRCPAGPRWCCSWTRRWSGGAGTASATWGASATGRAPAWRTW